MSGQSHGGGERVEAQFEANPRSVTQARHFVQEALGPWSIGEGLSWSAALAVTELAANAVMHALTAFVVAVIRDHDGLRLEVSDGSPRRPRIRQYGPDATTGRGLGLVARLSAEWGSSLTARGKTVWCVLTDTSARDADTEPDLDAFSDLTDVDEGPGARGSGSGACRTRWQVGSGRAA